VTSSSSHGGRRDAIFFVDEQARSIYVNEEACRILGYGCEELLGMGVPDDGRIFPVEISAKYLEYGDRAFTLAVAPLAR
jgi:PAS domain-containing protein